MPTLEFHIQRILNDDRLDDDNADEELLTSIYGADCKPGALYQLTNKFSWGDLYIQLIKILLDDKSQKSWVVAQTVLWYGSSDKRKIDPNYVIALLYYRFPKGIDDGDRIWSIVCKQKNKPHWSDYNPLEDEKILSIYKIFLN